MDRRISMLRALTFGLAFLVLIASSMREAHGQAISGNLVGTVIDSSSAVVTAATVEATKTAHENTDPVTKAGSQIAVKR